MELVDQIVIQVALSEYELTLTEFKYYNDEMRYNYKIWDGRTGNQMFFAEEDETCFNNAKSSSGGSRGSDREFVMPFVDAMGNEGFKLNKTRSIRSDNFGPKWCFCLCCCFMNSCFKSCMSSLFNYDND